MQGMKRLLLIISLLSVVCGCSKNESDVVYRVGDVYYGKNKTGLIFWVTDDGRHGKIVSLNYTLKVWIQDSESIFNKEFEETGATDSDDGMYNMKKIMLIDGWREKCPAFAWCADKGKDWYMPAINELVLLTESQLLPDIGPYWSSTEDENDSDSALSYWNGKISNKFKNEGGYIRAIAKF